MKFDENLIVISISRPTCFAEIQIAKTLQSEWKGTERSSLAFKNQRKIQARNVEKVQNFRTFLENTRIRFKTPIDPSRRAPFSSPPCRSDVIPACHFFSIFICCLFLFFSRLWCILSTRWNCCCCCCCFITFFLTGRPICRVDLNNIDWFTLVIQSTRRFDVAYRLTPVHLMDIKVCRDFHAQLVDGSSVDRRPAFLFLYPPFCRIQIFIFLF